MSNYDDLFKKRKRRKGVQISREEIEAAVAEYIRNGGTIKRILPENMSIAAKSIPWLDSVNLVEFGC